MLNGLFGSAVGSAVACGMSAFFIFRAMRKMPYLHDGSAVEILPWDIPPCTVFRFHFRLRPYSNTRKGILQINKISFGQMYLYRYRFGSQ